MPSIDGRERRLCMGRGLVLFLSPALYSQRGNRDDSLVQVEIVPNAHQGGYAGALGIDLCVDLVNAALAPPEQKVEV